MNAAKIPIFACRSRPLRYGEASDMDLAGKIAALDQLYALYDRFTAQLDLACRPKCATCCTANVTMTTLEGYKMWSFLRGRGRGNWSAQEALRACAERTRFMPDTTTNQMAALCMQGKPVPEQASDADGGSCPLLGDELCRIYEARPFGCRALVSRSSCEQKGYAEVDDYVFTVNTVLMQVTEHIDQNGLSGNLTDVLTALEPITQPPTSLQEWPQLSAERLIQNHPIPALLIPPEHRDQMAPMMTEIAGILKSL